MGKYFGSYSPPLYQKNEKFKNPTIFPSVKAAKELVAKSRKKYFTKSDLRQLKINPITLRSVLTKTFAYSTVNVSEAVGFLSDFYLDGYMRKVFRADGNIWKLPKKINISMERGLEILNDIFI